MLRRLGIALVALASVTLPTFAADLISGGGNFCRIAGTSELVLEENLTRLNSEVVRLMDEAVAVAASDEWIASPRPAFLWASEAKVACGKAHGYLKTSYKDEDTINKCECFHARMVYYMN